MSGDAIFPDADAFCARARRHALFAPGEPIVVARAPGRFDVLGGIADYAGGLVLGLPIRAAALAAAQTAYDGEVIAVSGARRLTITAAELVESPLADLSRRFSGRDAWAAYVLGPVALLCREERLRADRAAAVCSPPRFRRGKGSARPPRWRSRRRWP